MRKLKLQMQMTVNGFVAGPDNQLDWMIFEWDDGLKEYANKLTDSVDTIILGRKMTEGFISHWKNVANNPDDPEYETAKKFVKYKKVVFTKTLDTSPWKNTTLAKGALAAEIQDLKDQDGKDIIVYGGASFVSNLVSEGLIDEFYLFVNPVGIADGKTIFDQITDQKNLQLINAKNFDCGIVVLEYTNQQI